MSVYPVILLGGKGVKVSKPFINSFGWSRATGLNGLATNATSNVSWPKDNDHRRLSSKNDAVESFSSSFASGGDNLFSFVVNSRSSNSSCSVASFLVAECRNLSQEAEKESQTLHGIHSNSSLATHVESSSEVGIIKETQIVY